VGEIPGQSSGVGSVDTIAVNAVGIEVSNGTDPSNEKNKSKLIS